VAVGVVCFIEGTQGLAEIARRPGARAAGGRDM
jgi:hypothetical protein